jgi:hypothetical protein
MIATGWIWNLFGWAALPLLAVLAFIFLYRRWVAEFPIFFSYVLITEAVGIARVFGSSAPQHVNFYIYWFSDIIYSLFALMATCELFIKHLFPGFYKIRFYRYLFTIAVVMTAFGSIIVALISGHATVLASTIYIYNLFRAAVLFFFVALMLVMGRQWNKLQFGIATGFMLDVAISLADLGIWSHTPSLNVLIGRISAIVYNLSCLIWIYCFWTAPKSTVKSLSGVMHTDRLQEARKWEEVLKDFLTSGKR